MRLLCRFGWHDWQNWDKFLASDIVNYVSKDVKGYQFVQRRHCNKCNKLQLSTTIVEAGSEKISKG